jgi:phosphoglycerol transferase MdoB-like AlkP superfamily enzyme
MKSFLRVLGYLVALHVLGLLALTVCRVIFLLANMPAEGLDWTLMPTAMLIGVKFDNLIACYLSALPFIVVPVWALVTLHRADYTQQMQRVVKGVSWYYGITYALLLFVHVANARYFHFFENHLNIGVTAWFGFVGDTAGMIFEDQGNWIYLLVAIAVIVLYICSLVVLTRRFMPFVRPSETLHTRPYVIAGVLTLLLWGAAFCGMRGSFQRYPLRVSFAYFSNKPFYNKLGVNPVFNIIKSAEYGRVGIPKELAAIDEQEALRYVQEELGIHPVDRLRPLVRQAEVHPLVEGRPNVVLIFMESMATENLERLENGQWLTPYLRELRDRSIYWTNCYSTGVHTNNGIVGVHYGFVPNFAKPIMDVQSDIYTGLPYYLKKNGYATMCFVTGNPQYDNMNSFWRDNHIEDLYSLYDYGTGAAVNNFGVSDGYMFDWGLRKLDERSREGKPFFATFLTVSNHGPFIVPEAFAGRAEKPKDQIIAYADEALRQFMEAAQQTEWGRNTVFVLVADHGAANIPHLEYDMPLSYNHIPVYICSDLLTPQQIDRPASQIDVWESVLSLLGIPYENNCLGVDVFSQSRRYAFFVGNEHLGVCDGSYFWCYHINSQKERLYRVGDVTDISEQEPERAADMRTFGMYMQRVNLMAIDKKWTEPCE